MLLSVLDDRRDMQYLPCSRPLLIHKRPSLSSRHPLCCYWHFDVVPPLDYRDSVFDTNTDNVTLPMGHFSRTWGIYIRCSHGRQFFSFAYLSPIHTADDDATQLFSSVAFVMWTHLSAVVCTRDPVYNFLCCWAIEVGDKWRHNDVLLKKLSISIKIHVVTPLSSLFGQFSNCRPNLSAVVVS